MCRWIERVKRAAALAALQSSVAVAFSAGCQEDILRPVSRGVQTTGRVVGQVRQEEAAFAELAAQAPSSAGFYLDSIGSLVVVVGDVADEERARDVVKGFVDAGRIRDPRAREGAIRIKRGQYSFVELANWRDAAFDGILMSIGGVVSLDLSERLNRVTIGVAPRTAAAARAQVYAALPRLGIDSAAVVINEHEAIRFLVVKKPMDRSPAHAALLPYGLDYGADTLFGGLRADTDTWTCSLGVIADRGSVRGLVTAAHCDDMWRMNQHAIYQPDNSHQVGSEHTDPEGWGCGFLDLDECRNSDASFYSLSSGILSYRGLIGRTQNSAGPNSGNGSILLDQNRPYFIITSVDDEDAYSGQTVQKIGRTSGWTWGHIENTCVDHRHDGWPDSEITQCAYDADYTSADGDSGGPVFAMEGDGYTQADLVRLLGITFGHVDNNSVFSKWGRIETDLGALTVTREPTLSTPSISGDISFYSPVISWSTVSGTTRYNVFREGPSGPELVSTTTSTSFSDGNSNVLEYTGSSPASGWNNNIQYYVYAVSGTEVSAKSNVVWYRRASGTFSVDISGPSVVGPNNYNCSVWVAQVTGASTITSYEWSGLFTSQDYYVEGTVPQTGGSLQLLVQDSQGRQGGYIKQITYDPNNQNECQ